VTFLLYYVSEYSCLPSVSQLFDNSQVLMPQCRHMKSVLGLIVFDKVFDVCNPLKSDACVNITENLTSYIIANASLTLQRPTG